MKSKIPILHYFVFIFLLIPSLVYAANEAPIVGTISPDSGFSRTNQIVSFRTTFSDGDGWKNIQDAALLIGVNTNFKANPLLRNFFCVNYNQNQNRLYVFDTANNVWRGGFAPGSANNIENAYGILHCKSTTVTGNRKILRVSWMITFKPLFPGRKNTYLYVKDDAGLFNDWTKVGTWIIDRDAPNGTITINNNEENTNSTQVNLALNANDALTGVSQMKFSNDNAVWTQAEPYAQARQWTLTQGDGQKTVYVKYRDGAGNWSRAFSDSIILDTTAPQVVIVFPENNFTTNNDSVKIQGTIDDNAATVTINGMSAVTGNGQFALDEVPVKNGNNTITVRAVDTAGNVRETSINVNVENLPVSQIIIDDFTDGQGTVNRLGFWTGDNQSCSANTDENGSHRISWNNNASYWYTDLWNEANLPNGTDISYYERLTFKIKGNAGGENFSVELEDIAHGQNFNKRIEIRNYINITRDWQEVTIPLKEFVVQGVWKTHARSISFQFDKTNSGTIFIDDIKLRHNLIDTFADDTPLVNSLGYATGDDGTLAENIDINGFRKLRWNNANARWNTTLWDGNYEFDAHWFSYLYIRIRGEAGGENFSVELQDNRGSNSVEISRYADIQTSWRYIYIPLNDFAIDKSKLRNMTLIFNRTQSGTIYIDKIGITNANMVSAKPLSTGPVKILNNQLIVNDTPFQIKGVGYQPTPIGVDWRTNGLFQDAGIYNRDLPLIRTLGCNTIRVWKQINSHEFMTACYNNGQNPIYVIMGFPVEYFNLSDQRTRDIVKQEFREYVREYNRDPAVLAWALGNEVNMYYQGNIRDWYSLANELAEIAYQEEGEGYHPVMIVNKDLDALCSQENSNTDAQLNYIDIWGINVYRGLSFRGFFRCYKQISAKPLVVTEFGADAWHSDIVPARGYDDPVTQAEYYSNNWNEIKQTTGCAGGTLMEYTDEWWKAVGRNFDVQDIGIYVYRYDQPDSCANEEFWGLCKIRDNGQNPDIVIPRKAYEVMRLAYNNLPYPEMILAWEFNRDGDLEGWTAVQSLNGLAAAEGTLRANVTGVNPLLNSANNLSINGLLYSGMDIRLKASSGIKAKIFWKKQGDADFSDQRSSEFVIIGDGNFHDYSFYLGNNPEWNGTITQLRINPTSASNGQIEIDYIRIVQGDIPQDFVPPEDVTNLAAVSGNERVTLNWTRSRNSQGDLNGQILYISGGAAPVSLGVDAITHAVNGLTNGQNYTFRITSIDNALNESTGTTVQCTPRDTTAPENITNLTAVAGDRSVTLNWVRSINTEGDLANHILYIDNGQGQRIGQAVNTYTVNNLNNGQLYRFRITCVDEADNESSGVTVQAIPQQAGAPVVRITNPVNGAITRNNTTNVSGTVNNNQAVVTVNGIRANVNAGAFTANNVPLANEEANTINVTAVLAGRTGLDQITVYRDTTPPDVEAAYPKDGETVVGRP